MEFRRVLFRSQFFFRRDQAPTRANAKKIEWDKSFGLVKCNPLADWEIGRASCREECRSQWEWSSDVCSSDHNFFFDAIRRPRARTQKKLSGTNRSAS